MATPCLPARPPAPQKGSFVSMSITGSAQTQTPAAASSSRRNRSPSIPPACYLAAIAALDERDLPDLSTPGHPNTYNAETIAAVLSEWLGDKVGRTTVAMRLRQLWYAGEVRREEVPGAAFAHGPAYVYGLA